MCLIRLRDLRPEFLPLRTSLTSEHLAHRIAVEIPGDGSPGVGVYIPRRETCSRTALLGSRMFFSGGLHQARFVVRERDASYRIEVASNDGAVRVLVDGSLDAAMPSGSVFRSLNDASSFFSEGCVGYSDGSQAGIYDGVRLSMRSWTLQPVRLSEAHSSLLDDRSVFPAGSLVLDSAFLMAGVESTWDAVAGVHGSARAA